MPGSRIEEEAGTYQGHSSSLNGAQQPLQPLNHTPYTPQSRESNSGPGQVRGCDQMCGSKYCVTLPQPLLIVFIDSLDSLKKL